MARFLLQLNLLTAAMLMMFLFKLERKMANTQPHVHSELPGTSWLFNGFILLSIGWMFLSMAFSGPGPSLDNGAAQASLILTE